MTLACIGYVKHFPAAQFHSIQSEVLKRSQIFIWIEGKKKRIKRNKQPSEWMWQYAVAKKSVYIVYLLDVFPIYTESSVLASHTLRSLCLNWFYRYSFSIHRTWRFTRIRNHIKAYCYRHTHTHTDSLSHWSDKHRNACYKFHLILVCRASERMMPKSMSSQAVFSPPHS